MFIIVMDDDNNKFVIEYSKLKHWTDYLNCEVARVDKMRSDIRTWNFHDEADYIKIDWPYFIRPVAHNDKVVFPLYTIIERKD